MEFFISNNANVNTLFCGSPKGEAKEHNLGGNLYFGDPATYCPEVFKYIIKRFGVKSVLDVGSGLGFLPLFLKREFDLDVIGMEGWHANIENAIYPLVQWDLTQGSFKTSKVDLVTCIEVVEHIEEKYIDNLMDTLTQGRIAIITHALPGTNGEFHVNEKDDMYWIEKFASRGFALLPLDTQIIRSLDQKEVRGAGYFSQSGLVFGRLPQGLSVNFNKEENHAENKDEQK